MACHHEELCLDTSSHASQVGYNRPTKDQRIKAAITTASKKIKLDEQADAFPAPLVLPEDDLAYDPKYPAQSLRSWVREKERNEVTSARRTIYVVDCPEIDPSVDGAADWALPTTKAKMKRASSESTTRWSTSAVVEYVAAFYHGLPVKFMKSGTFRFVPWSDDKAGGSVGRKSGKKTTKPTRIGLANGDVSVGIRTRKPPDRVFPQQLNLDDLLDAAIDNLPDDAYAFVMLVDHDLYEDEDDDFCIGRAYGGSRVAVISAARYNPLLDQHNHIDKAGSHIWPDSHCLRYMQKEASNGTDTQSRAPSTVGLNDEQSPLRVASNAVRQFRKDQKHEEDSSKWLGRICRTVSHELGHCFGIDHCVYYACCMQGTASVAEDLRQPPYLCPVDLAKVLRATGGTQEQHYQAMLEFCKKHHRVELFAAYGAWITARLAQLKG